MKRVVLAGWFVLMSWVSLAQAVIPSTTGWYQIPNTTIDALNTCTTYPTVCPIGQQALFDWSGAVYDYVNHRMIFFGGGHAGYYGNEMYALNLSVDPITMTRITAPTLPIATSCTPGIPPATQVAPNSRHTYDGIEHSRFFNMFFAYEGSLACPAGDTGKDTWTYDFNAATWTQRDPVGGDNISTLCGLNFGMTSAWDSATGLIFIYNRCALYTYNPNTNTYRQVSTNSGTSNGYHLTGSIDPVKRLFVLVGYDDTLTSFEVYSIDISGIDASGAPPAVLPNITIQASVDPGFPSNNYPGCDFYPRRQAIICWNGGNTAFQLNTTTWAWTSTTFTGGPGNPHQFGGGDGTLGKFRYSPLLDVFVLMTETANNAYSLRLDTPLTPEQDFSNRCAATGVIVCQGFDSTLPLSTGNDVTGVKPDWQGGYTRQAIDTAVKASGAGSFRLTIQSNTDANMAGEYRQVWGTAFGQNSTMYTSFRYRADSAFVNTDWNALLATWPKVVIHHNQVATYGDVEWTMTNDQYSTMIPTMYTAAATQQVVTNGGIPPYDYHQAHLKCSYGSTTPLNGVSSCLYLEPNKWMTFKFKATIGTWGVANSHLEAWFSVDGLPWRKWIDIPNYMLVNTPPVSPGYDSVTLTPYMTGRTVAQTAPQAQVWYDELIISSQDIAAPLPSISSP